ncbi:MAG: hypothetical protein RLO08_01830 [Parvibaculaceae bacterium]
MRIIPTSACPITALLLLCFSVLPVRADPYRDCVQLVAIDPDAAYDAALAWESQDTTGGALHCGGLALTALGLYDAAAERLLRAAEKSLRATDVEKATIYRQAGDAWLLAGRGQEAAAAFTQAIGFVPLDPALFYGRARAYDVAGQPVDAFNDINQAIDLDPGRGQSYLLRARLYRQLNQMAEAEQDIERALQSGIDDIPVLLERGLIRYEQSDFAGALEDWTAVQAADVRSDGTRGAAGAAATRFIEALQRQTGQAETPTQP